MKFLGVDIGCSSIKYGVVDLSDGVKVDSFDTIVIPQVSRAIKYLVALKSIIEQNTPYLAAGFGFPSIVRDNTIYRDDIDFNGVWHQIEDMLTQNGIPNYPLNDADASGIAEVYRKGAENLCKGATIVLTLGTGIGSAIFLDGKLLANTELGRLEMNGMISEFHTAPSVITKEGLTVEAWAGRFQEYLELMEILLAPDHIVLGGGISVDFDQFKHLLKTRASLQTAYYRNRAGVVGAAIYAAHQTRNYTLDQL